MDWDLAKKHFDAVKSEYEALINTPGVNVQFALAFTFQPLADRYDAGERSAELYEAMMAVC